MKLTKWKFCKEQDIPCDYDVRNDKIKNVQIYSNHNCLSVHLTFESGNQGVGEGINETYNIGNILQCYAQLCDVDTDYCRDIISQLKGTPIRVASKLELGSFIVDHMYLGNFMKDKWIRLKELFGRLDIYE